MPIETDKKLYDSEKRLVKHIYPLGNKIVVQHYETTGALGRKEILTLEQYQTFKDWHNEEDPTKIAEKAAQKVVEKFESTEEKMPQEKRGPGRPRKNDTEPRLVQHKFPPKVQTDAENALLNLLSAGVAVKTEAAIREAVQDTVDSLENYLLLLQNEIKKHKHLTITTPLGTTTVKGRQHMRFEAMLKALNTNFPLMLVGTAGSGKTYSAEQAAEALSIDFFATSVGAQTSKSDLLGYMTANGTYVGTAFRNAYENGGLFLLDEIDAGNSNVLIVLNAALSGTFCSFPDGMIRRHENFKCVAAGNTYGTGASRTYVGRNQLDAATLDRFLIFDWPVDEKLELDLISEYQDGIRWHKTVLAIRRLCESRDYRVIVSPRAAIKGAQLLSLGFSFGETLDMSILANAPMDHKKALTDEATSVWNLG